MLALKRDADLHAGSSLSDHRANVRMVDDALETARSAELIDIDQRELCALVALEYSSKEIRKALRGATPVRVDNH